MTTTHNGLVTLSLCFDFFYRTMNNCKIKKLPNCFANLTNLKHLSVSYNEITELRPVFLKFATQLRSLNINRNFISCKEVEGWNVDFLDRSCSEDMQQNVTEYCIKFTEQSECLSHDLCMIRGVSCVPKERPAFVLPSYLKSGVSGLAVSWLLKAFVTLF